MATRAKWIGLTAALLGALLVPLTAQAISYTWSGTTSTAWNDSGNWNSAGPPGSIFTDTALININHNEPVILTTTADLGGLTITTGANTTALNINSGGALEMQGNIANSRTITINTGGILDNASGGSMTMNGTITMGGGQITSSGGGLIASSSPITGGGTISAPMTSSNTIKASGSTPLVLKSTITGGSIYAFTTATLGEIQLNGANLTNVTLTGSGNGSTASDFNVTGASTLTGTINDGQYYTMTVNALLNLSAGTISNFGSGQPLYVVNTGGTLNNVSGMSSIGGTDIVKMAGGSVTNTSGTSFTINTPITGFGGVSGPVTIGSNGNIQASGGTLFVDGTSGTGITLTGNTLFTNGALGSVLDLKGNINFGSGGFLLLEPIRCHRQWRSASRRRHSQRHHQLKPAGPRRSECGEFQHLERHLQLQCHPRDQPRQDLHSCLRSRLERQCWFRDQQWHYCHQQRPPD